jgi:membrane associated rhomboid family serine protease
MRNGRTFEKIVYWLFADRIPATKLIIISNALTFFVMAFTSPGAITRYFAFDPRGIASSPWTPVTYPLIGFGGPIAVAFGGYWLWLAGGSLERSWGTRTYVIFFFLMSAISAAGLTLGAVAAGLSMEAARAVGLWMPIAGVTVAFGMLNPEQVILLFFVIPLKLKYLALIDAVAVLVTYGMKDPYLGVAALLGCAFSYFYVTRGSRLWFGDRGPDRHKEKIIRLHSRRTINPLRWYGIYRERKRFRDFLHKSGFGD